MAKIRTFYDELGVGPDANETELRHAFKELAKEYHPDLNPRDKQEWAHEKMSRLNFILDTLTDDTTRREYDELIDKAQRGLDHPRRTERQEYALHREYARVSVEIINLAEKYSNCRLKILIGGSTVVAGILSLVIFELVGITSTLLIAFGEFLPLVGLIMAAFGASDYLGRGHYRARIDELESRRSDLKRRMFEVWSPY